MKIIFKGGSNEFKKCDEKLMKQFYFINNLVLLEQFQKFFKSFLAKMSRKNVRYSRAEISHNNLLKIKFSSTQNYYYYKDIILEIF